MLKLKVHLGFRALGLGPLDNSRLFRDSGEMGHGGLNLVSPGELCGNHMRHIN